MIMVDELRVWAPGGPRCFAAGSCHLTTDGNIEQLHAFAKRLGLHRQWFQSDSVPHYDLTSGRRKRALQLGATFVPAKQQAHDRIRKRAEYLLNDPLI